MFAIKMRVAAYLNFIYTKNMQIKGLFVLRSAQTWSKYGEITLKMMCKGNYIWETIILMIIYDIVFC